MRGRPDFLASRTVVIVTAQVNGEPVGEYESDLSEFLQQVKALAGEPSLSARTARDLIAIAEDRSDHRAELATWALGFGTVPTRQRARVLDVLTDLLADRERDPKVRGQAAESIGELFEYHRASPARRRAVAALLVALGDELPEVRFWAVFSLGKIRDAAAVPAIQALTGDPAVIAGWGAVDAEARGALRAIARRPVVE